ncbi:MAG: hypothetical protein ACRDCT_25505, partial [Shewanella sp.]
MNKKTKQQVQTSGPRDYKQICDGYIADVLSGRKNVCKFVRQAVERHIRDLKRAGTEEFPYVYDQSRADKYFY